MIANSVIPHHVCYLQVLSPFGRSHPDLLHLLNLLSINHADDFVPRSAFAISGTF